MPNESIRVLALTTHPDRAEAASLIGLSKQGVDLRVRMHPDALAFDTVSAAGVPVAPMTISRKLDKAVQRSIRKDLLERPVDILHTYNNKTIMNGLIASRGIDVGVIAYRGIVGNESFLNPVSWMRYLNPRVDHIVCVAEAIRQFFLEMGMPGVRMRRDKPVTIHKGHSLDWYRDEPVDRASIDIPADAFVVGCIANSRPRKGIDVLLKAMELLPPDSPVHLLLAGRMDSPKLQALFASHPRPERLHVLGFRRDAPQLIAACDAAVLPSVKREGLPKTVIEAMAYSVPPIVTDCGGSPELVEHGKSGLVVPVRDPQAIADAIQTLSADRELSRQLGASARERIRTAFTTERTVSKTLELYRSLVERRAGEGRHR